MVVIAVIADYHLTAQQLAISVTSNQEWRWYFVRICWVILAVYVATDFARFMVELDSICSLTTFDHHGMHVYVYNIYIYVHRCMTYQYLLTTITITNTNHHYHCRNIITHCHHHITGMVKHHQKCVGAPNAASIVDCSQRSIRRFIVTTSCRTFQARQQDDPRIESPIVLIIRYCSFSNPKSQKHIKTTRWILATAFPENEWLMKKPP